MLDNLTKKQKIILLIITSIVIIGMMYLIYTQNTLPDNTENEMLIVNEISQEKNTESEDTIIVHITGSVKNPGIVKLKEGSRIEDAIETAGGLTENADITSVNLAYILEDGIKIRIPSTEEEEIIGEEIIDSSSGENIIVKENTVTETKTGQTININKATETDLQTLPGIGASLASKIIEYRTQNGKFASKEDIKNVNGIGESKYEKIKDLIIAK